MVRYAPKMMENKVPPEVPVNLTSPEISPGAAPDRPKIWSPWATVGFGALAFITASVVGSFVAVGYVLVSNPDSLSNFNPAAFMSNGMLLALTTISTAVAGLPLVLIFIQMKQTLSVREYLGLKRINLKTILFLIALTLVLVAAAEGFNHFVPDPSTQSMLDAYNSMQNTAWLWIGVVVAAPLFEEALFRGFLFVGLVRSRWGVGGTIVLTAATWAGLHAQYDLTGIFTVMFFGLVLGYVRYRTKNLWSTLIMHAAWNFFALAEIALLAAGYSIGW